MQTQMTGTLIGLCLLSCAACLVTKDVDYTVANSPPSVVAIRPAKFARVPTTSAPECPQGADAVVYVLFEATIFDVDVDQTLQARLIVNGNPPQGQKEIGPLTGNPRVRTFPPFCIDANSLRQACNRVQLLVSSGFDPLGQEPDDTLLEDDIGREEWFLLGSPQDSSDAIPSDCSRLVQPPDGGLP